MRFERMDSTFTTRMMWASVVVVNLHFYYLKTIDYKTIKRQARNPRQFLIFRHALLIRDEDYRSFDLHSDRI